jgi:probable HAF family extracellular repeat protein
VNRCRRRLFALVATCATALPAHAAVPSFAPIGSLPNAYAPWSSASAISDDGLTVSGDVLSGTSFDGFRWTRDGGFVTHGMTQIYQYARGQAVSADGTYVVGYHEDPQGLQAFRHSAAGVDKLGFLHAPSQYGKPSSEAKGISGDGQIVVGSASGDGGSGAWRTRAFKWTASGGMVPLPFLPGGGEYNAANAISRDGSAIVGTSDLGSWPNSTFHAYILRDGHAIQSLGDLPGGNIDATATAISDDTQFVVGTSSSANGLEAFRWSAATGTMIGLGDLPGALSRAAPPRSVATARSWSASARRAAISPALSGIKPMECAASRTTCWDSAWTWGRGTSAACTM